MAFNFERKVARPREEETALPKIEETVANNYEPIVERQEAAVFEPGTAIYKLVAERLEVLEKTITNAEKEYEELSKYIKGEA